jgi:hypothetical protein
MNVAPRVSARNAGHALKEEVGRGLLVHSIERNKGIVPYSFTISYLMVVLIGCYMVPSSGMTFFMLPHAVYMLIRNHLKAGKVRT